MNEREKHQIGFELFKRVLVKQFALKDIQDIKGKIRNFSEETNISEDKLLVFSKIVLRETLEEEFVRLNKGNKVGFK